MKMIRELEKLFARHRSGGKVRVGYETKVYTGVVRPAEDVAGADRAPGVEVDRAPGVEVDGAPGVEVDGADGAAGRGDEGAGG
jgi:hypothetical protein